jgi:hypothetical protein
MGFTNLHIQYSVNLTYRMQTYMYYVNAFEIPNTTPGPLTFHCISSQKLAKSVRLLAEWSNFAAHIQRHIHCQVSIWGFAILRTRLKTRRIKKQLTISCICFRNAIWKKYDIDNNILPRGFLRTALMCFLDVAQWSTQIRSKFSCSLILPPSFFSKTSLYFYKIHGIAFWKP